MATSFSGSANGSGRSATAFSTEKQVVAAPIPSASVTMKIRVKEGCRASCRMATRRSCRALFICRMGSATYMPGREGVHCSIRLKKSRAHGIRRPAFEHHRRRLRARRPRARDRRSAAARDPSPRAGPGTPEDRLQRIGPDLVALQRGMQLVRSFIIPSNSLPSASASLSLTLRKRIVLPSANRARFALIAVDRRHHRHVVVAREDRGEDDRRVGRLRRQRSTMAFKPVRDVGDLGVIAAAACRRCWCRRAAR